MHYVGSRGQCVSPVHGSYNTVFHHNCTVSIMMDEAHFRLLSFVFVHQFVSVRNKSGWQSSLLLNQEMVIAQIQNTSLYLKYCKCKYLST